MGKSKNTSFSVLSAVRLSVFTGSQHGWSTFKCKRGAFYQLRWCRSW